MKGVFVAGGEDEEVVVVLGVIVKVVKNEVVHEMEGVRASPVVLLLLLTLPLGVKLGYAVGRVPGREEVLLDGLMGLPSVLLLGSVPVLSGGLGMYVGYG